MKPQMNSFQYPLEGYADERDADKISCNYLNLLIFTSAFIGVYLRLNIAFDFNDKA
jgi:hypothetical protein